MGVVAGGAPHRVRAGTASKRLQCSKNARHRSCVWQRSSFALLASASETQHEHARASVCKRCVQASTNRAHQERRSAVCPPGGTCCKGRDGAWASMSQPCEPEGNDQG